MAGLRPQNTTAGLTGDSPMQLRSIRGLKAFLSLRAVAGFGSAAVAGVIVLGMGQGLMAHSPDQSLAAKAGAEDVSKSSIKDVMKRAYKGDDALVKRVMGGKATK